MFHACHIGELDLKVFWLAMLLPVLAACGDNVQEYVLEQETISQFEAGAERLAARDDERSPLAISVLAGNGAGIPAGVQVWHVEKTLFSTGIRNGAVIASVDGEVPSREYGSSFGANQKPFSSATQQYVNFVSELLARRHSKDSILLSVHARYRTREERKKHGGLHTKEPTLIRVIFP